MAALTASQLRPGRKKIGCAPGAGSFSCAPWPDAVPLQSDGVHSNRLTSSFGSFPSRARLGSTCLYGSASFSSLLFFLDPIAGAAAELHRQRRRVPRFRRCPRPAPARPSRPSRYPPLLPPRRATLPADHSRVRSAAPPPRPMAWPHVASGRFTSRLLEDMPHSHRDTISLLRLLRQDTLGALWPCSAACSLRMLSPMR